MSESQLDRLVKGAPPPNTSVSQVAAAAGASTSPSERTSFPRAAPPNVSDPTSLLPSFPPQIYLNLLILEASLRAQFLALRARRRQNTLVLLLLSLWIAHSTHAVFLRLREDGTGTGGSVYWVLDTTYKVSFIGGIVMAVLFRVTGQWERGIRWPRRWLGVTNRGLRQFNCKAVILRGPWWKEFLGWWGFGIFSTPGSSYHYIEYTREERRQMLAQGRPRVGGREKEGVAAEEDIAPGGDYLKIVLLPKPFTPDFRENWELFRSEYWEKENERRAELRKRVKARQREIAKQEGGWLWWTGWRGWKYARGLGRSVDVEKSQYAPSSLTHPSSLREKQKRRPSILRERERDGSHSRSSSRSSTTPTDELGKTAALSERERRWSSSTTSSTSDRRRTRKPLPSTSSAGGSSGNAPRLGRLASATSSRPTTPGSTKQGSLEMVPSLNKRASTLSTSSDQSSVAGEDEKKSATVA